MEQKADKIKYFVYARKSSESEDRQIQSIDDQLDRLKKLANDLSLHTHKVFTESKSAKKPDNRPLFDEMLERIEAGEANGILCWQINRLSRNPIDSGKLSWLLQQGVLKSIQTIDRQYLPDDNVLLFSVETGVANQYVIDLRKNTRRGVESKAGRGWLPSLAPLGYLNEKIEKTIIEDPERFQLVRKLWDLMLTGAYTAPQVLEIATKEWGLRTRKMKRIGGNPISVSGIYALFTNLFYTGNFEWDGQQFEGKHKPMITLAEFDKVQLILGKKGKARGQTHRFAFTGMIRCGECGCMYTAETKKKIIKSTGEARFYTYYHCTRKTRKVVCTQRKAIREEELEQQMSTELTKYTILLEFRDWALEILNRNNDKEIEERSKVQESQQRELLSLQSELDNLTKMRYRDLINDEEFKNERAGLQKKLADMRGRVGETESRADRWVELTERVFNFATNARTMFLNGDLNTKKEILVELGQNPIIKDGKFSIQAHNWLQPIANDYPALEKEYRGLEPAGSGINAARTAQIQAIKSTWLRHQGSNLGPTP